MEKDEIMKKQKRLQILIRYQYVRTLIFAMMVLLVCLVPMNVAMADDSATDGNTEFSEDASTTAEFQSDQSRYPELTPVSSTLKEVPVTEVIVVSKTSLKVCWKKQKKASGYLIFRKNESSKSYFADGRWQQVGSVVGGQKKCFIDTQLNYKDTYSYQVVPYKLVNKKNEYGPFAPEAKTFTLKYSSKYKKGYKLYYDSEGKLIKDVDKIIGKRKKYKIKVNTEKCVVTVYALDSQKKYRIPVKAFLCSPGDNTGSGNFIVGQRYRYRVLFYNSYSQWTVHIHGNILFHTTPYTTYENKKSLDPIEYNKLGTRASHGCIRMQCEGVKWIYDRCPYGSKVVIYKGKSAGPLGKPKLEKLPKWHTWDPTDPTCKALCAKKRCH